MRNVQAACRALDGARPAVEHGGHRSNVQRSSDWKKKWRPDDYARRLITLIFADRVAGPAVMVMIRREIASYLLRGTATRRTTREGSPLPAAKVRSC